MPVQKAPIRDDRADEERPTDGCHNDLGNRTCREVFDYLGSAHWRHVSQGSPRRLGCVHLLSRMPHHVKQLLKDYSAKKASGEPALNHTEGSGSERNRLN